MSFECYCVLNSSKHDKQTAKWSPESTVMVSLEDFRSSSTASYLYLTVYSPSHYNKCPKGGFSGDKSDWKRKNMITFRIYQSQERPCLLLPNVSLQISFTLLSQTYPFHRFEKGVTVSGLGRVGENVIGAVKKTGHTWEKGMVLKKKFLFILFFHKYWLIGCISLINVFQYKLI